MAKLNQSEVAERMARIKNLAKKKKKVHYTEVSYALKLSPTIALQWCKIVANMDPNFTYAKGFLTYNKK